MNSAVDEKEQVLAAVARWQYLPISRIREHESKCCQEAREWLTCMDSSFAASGGRTIAPYWIRDVYEWGPCRWPLTWCEVINMETVDCGVLAAIAVLLLKARGVICFPVQLVMQYSPQDIEQWRGRWQSERIAYDWTLGNMVYHEACAVTSDHNSVRIWDPTDCLWLDDSSVAGYSSVRAVRLVPEKDDGRPDVMLWGKHELANGLWVQLV